MQTVDLRTISLEAIRARKVAILGYGNQGRNHALNLRDSKVTVHVGSRAGKGATNAKEDGFEPLPFLEAIQRSDIIMFLLPDHTAPLVYQEVGELLRKGKKWVGFAHGFSYHYQTIERFSECRYFLAAPKGAGALLRSRFVEGGGLPGVYSVENCPDDPEFKQLVLSYCKATGIGAEYLRESTFQEETEGDLFGEQAVLCGGLMRLMEESFNILVANGHSKETAFLDTCYEARMILELWMKFGPLGLFQRVSPTAFFGGLSRGKRLIDSKVLAELNTIFDEVRNGQFKKEMEAEVKLGMPNLQSERERIQASSIQKAFEALAPYLNP